MEWSNWFVMNESTRWLTGHGIYRVHLERPDGEPIPRIADVDSDGIVYIGRSEPSTTKTDRSLRWRLRNEFLHPNGSHSGG